MGQKDPEEQARFAAQRAEWARHRLEFETMYEDLKARWHAEDELIARRQARIRKLTLGLLGR